MSRIKERLTQQLLDGELRSYLMEKEHWNADHVITCGSLDSSLHRLASW
jgi:hypothetical protein